MTMDYVDICPPAIVYRIQEADLKSADASELLVSVQSEADTRCVLAATEAVARRITPLTDPQVFDAFCNTVATYAADFEADQIPVLREAYLHFPYDPDLAGNYFAGLRETGIDLRAELKGKVRVDWSFATPYSPGDTWDYYLYLAALNEPGAVQALADKIAATQNGNDATLLLASLAQVPGKAVDEVLKSYANDRRTADGVEGPGLPIADNIRILLTRRGAQ